MEVVLGALGVMIGVVSAVLAWLQWQRPQPHREHARMAEPASQLSFIGQPASGLAAWVAKRRSMTAVGREPSWPVQVGRPPRLAGAFQQRSKLKSQVQAGLSNRGTAVLSQVVASGNGGVGKTQLAASIFEEARDAGTDLVMWITASTRSAVISAYAEAAEMIGISMRADAAAETAAGRFLDWLATTDCTWLVALDDVAEPSDLNGLWPRGRTGAVLVTTRLRDLAAGHGVPVAVDVFTAAESLAYLSERLGSSTVETIRRDVLEEAAELADDLGHLPVAMAHAAAVIAHEGITCVEYRRRFANGSAALDELFPSRPPDEYAFTVAATWVLAIDRAESLASTGLARAAMQVAAVLDPNGAPDSLWVTRPILEWATNDSRSDIDSGGDAKAGGRSDAMRRALRSLHRFSLLTHDPNGGSQAVRTHAMVQRTVIHTLDDEQLCDLVRATADALVDFWPELESDQELAQSLRANAAALAARHIDALYQPRVHPLMLRTGRSMGDAGLVAQAVDYLSEVVQAATQLNGSDHSQTLVVRGELARWKGIAGDLVGATGALERLLTDTLRVLGPRHPQTLAVRGDLAHWRVVAVDPIDTIRFFEEMLDEMHGLLGERHPDVLAARCHLDRWRSELGRKTLGALAEVVTERVRLLGVDHLDTLTARRRLAHWQAQIGDISTAVVAASEVVDDCTRVLGAEHLETFTARSVLAFGRGLAGDPHGAVSAYEELVADASHVLGPDHPDTLEARHNLVHWQGLAGDPSIAVSAMEQLLADKLRVLGPDHPHTLTARSLLAIQLRRKGDPASAVVVGERLLADRVRVLGSEHPHTLAARYYIARARGEAEDTARAVAEFEDLFKDQVRVLGPDHPDTLTTRYNIERWREHGGDASGERPSGSTEVRHQ